jgi:hypothetical protein
MRGRSIGEAIGERRRLAVAPVLRAAGQSVTALAADAREP